VTAGANGYLPLLSDEEVLAAVREHAGAEAASRVPMRLQPSGPVPQGKVFRMPVPLPDGRYLAVSFEFGHDDPVYPEFAWKPAWRSVDGPLTREELEQL
jgi:hypothetical protein